MRKAVTITLEESEKRCLERLKRGRRVSVRLAERAAIVLLAAGDLENQEIATQLDITRQKAGRWRDRYAEHGLPGIEKDAPRPGRHRRINDRQRAAVVRKTLRETPAGQTHWSRTTMAAATGLSPSRSDVSGVNMVSNLTWLRHSSCPTIQSLWRNLRTSLVCISRPLNMPSYFLVTRRVRFKRWIVHSQGCR